MSIRDWLERSQREKDMLRARAVCPPSEWQYVLHAYASSPEWDWNACEDMLQAGVPPALMFEAMRAAITIGRMQPPPGESVAITCAWMGLRLRKEASHD